MGRRGSGVALAYVVLVATLLIVFTAALLSRFLHTLRVVRYDEDTVRASRIADSGATLAAVLMRDRDVYWHRALGTETSPGRWEVDSSQLGLGAAELGGTFHLEIVEDSSFLLTGGASGSFLSVFSTGEVSSRRRRTVVTLKQTNPALAYSLLARNDLDLAYQPNQVRTVTGPVAANGKVRLIHQSQFLEPYLGTHVHNGQVLRLAADVRAAGDIAIRGQDARPGHRLHPPLPLAGRLDPAALNRDPGFFGRPETEVTAGPLIRHHDLLIDSACATSPCPLAGHGGVELLGALDCQANQPLRTAIPEVEDLLARYRDPSRRPRDARFAEVSVDGHPQGVLAEFHGGRLYLSQAESRPAARLFDADLFLSQGSVIEWLMRCQFGTGNERARLAREVAWNDPDYPDAPYPPATRAALAGSALDPAPAAGDYLEIRRLTRGAALTAPVELGRSWTVVYLTASRTTPDAYGQPQAPPVFVRGVVEGKCALVYDGDPSLPAEAFRVLVLAQHEDGERDTDPGRRLPGQSADPSTWVPGGLHYADPRVKARSDAAGGSTDLAVVLSRGFVAGVGDSSLFKERVDPVAPYDDVGTDYTAYLESLEGRLAAAYPAERQAEFRLTDAADAVYNNYVRVPVHGALMAQSTDDRKVRLSCQGEVVVGDPDRIGGLARGLPGVGRRHPWYWTSFTWQETFPEAAWPAGSAPGDRALFPLQFRGALIPKGCAYRLTGCLHSLGGHLVPTGDTSYDYRFRELSADEVYNGLGFPLTVVTCAWQRN